MYLSVTLVGFWSEQFSNDALSDSEAPYRSKISVGFGVEQVSNVKYRYTVKRECCLSLQNNGRLRGHASKQCVQCRNVSPPSETQAAVSATLVDAKMFAQSLDFYGGSEKRGTYGVSSWDHNVKDTM